MFIKCPKCETSYEVPDNYIAEEGQNVKCFNCANVWFQERKETVIEEKNNNSGGEELFEGFSIAGNFLAGAEEIEDSKIEEGQEETIEESKTEEDVKEEIVSALFTEEDVEENIEEEKEDFSAFKIEFSDEEDVKSEEKTEEASKEESQEEKSVLDEFVPINLDSLDEVEEQVSKAFEDENPEAENINVEIDEEVLEEVSEEVENIDENAVDDDLAALMQFAKSGVDIEEETEEVDDIVSKLSKFNKQIDDIESSQDLLDKILYKIYKEKTKKMNIPVIKRYVTGVFIALIVLLIGVFFHGRYTITKHAPFTKYVYNILRIPAVIAGEGLEFKNVTKREYEEDYERKMEIKGFIINKTEENVDIPLIYIEVLDKDGVFLQKQVAEASIESLAPGASTGFTVTIESASRFAKYIVANFKHKKGINGI